MLQGTGKQWLLTKTHNLFNPALTSPNNTTITTTITIILTL
jgi:hypothetical protein